jgi:cobalt-zinc-cadmium efflux system outer membrane protein
MFLGLVCPLLSAEALTQNDAYSRFVERNPGVKAEREKLEIARGRLRQAGVLPNPTLVYGQEGYPIGEPDTSLFEDQEFLIGARQRFELGGKRDKRLELAQLELEAQQARYNDFLRLRRREVGRLFAATHFIQTRKSLLARCQDTYERLREVHRKRLEMGEVSPLAQMKIDVEGLAYLAELAVADRQLLSSWTELAALIVWESREIPTLSIENVPASASFSEDAVIETAIRTRPDLSAQRLEEQISDASLELEKAESLPDLTLAGGYKRDFGFNSFFFGLELPLPVFDRREGAIAERSAAVRRETNLTSWKEMMIRSEVRRAFEVYRKLQESSQQVDFQLLENLDRIVEVTELSYEEGESTILEYLDALRTQRDAAVNYGRLLQELYLSFLELEAAAGVSLRRGRP